MNNLKDVASMSEEDVRSALTDSQNRLFHVSRQLEDLDAQINYLRKLFRRAEKNNAYAVRYNLRMQLSISSGVKVMYHHYAAMMESRITSLRTRINDSSSSSSTSDEVVEDRAEP